ncbi:MAG: TolC family protein [Rhodospirillaceae bacterium]
MKHFRRLIQLAALCALSIGSAHAQLVAPAADAPSIDRLTLQQAEALFNERNREVRAARRIAEGAEADVISARARPNPTLSIGTTSISPSNGVGSGNILNKRVDTTIGLSQLIERGNKRELRTQAAEYSAAAARNEEADVARQQRGTLYAAYYDLVLAQERIRVTEDTAGLFGKTVDAANQRLKAGDISPTELARISVDALRAQNDARAARAERDKAQLVLGYLIGGEQNASHIVAVDTWPLDQPLPDMSAIERIVDQRADIQAAKQRQQAAERQRELARALRTRDVVAGVQYERFPSDVSNNSYGVSVSIPLFTSYYYQGEIRRAEVELQAAEENVERTRALAIADVQRALSELAAATERVRRFREVLLAAADKAASGAEFAYSRGAIGVMDLLDARRQLYATRLESVAAQADYARALAAWRAATSVVPVR